MGYSVDFVESVIDGECPRPRGGHSAVTAENQIVIFGGSDKQNGEFVYYNETYVLDTKERAWHKVRCSGEVPAGRYGHSVELVGSRMFVFGGRGERGALRDVYLLDLVEWTWVAVSATSASPSPRFFHASLLVGRKIVVHGGWDGRLQCLDDLWVFDTDAFSWLKPKTVGLAPSPRYGHALELLEDGRVLCFGGASLDSADPVPTYRNDLRALDTETMVWTKPSVGGDVAPSPRYSMTTAQLDEEVGVAIFGGWGVGGLQTPSAANLKGAASFYLLAFDQTTTTTARGVVDMKWVRPKTPAAPLPHKYGHTMTKVGSVLYVFGGWNGKLACNDLTEIALLRTTDD